MFFYRSLSRELIEDLTDRLLQAQSLALFAQRFGGKRYVLRQLFEGAQKAGRAPLVWLPLLEEPAVMTKAELHQRLRESLAPHGILVTTEQDPFAAIADYARTSGKRLLLFVTNLDSIPHDLTRHLLRQFRRLVEECALTVAMTGESDFHDLVAGENSEFTSSENYFLQGYDLSEFGVLLDQYLHTLGIKLVDRDAVVELLWQRSGGNSYLLRPLVLQLVESMVREGQALQSRPFTAQDFADLPNAKELPGNYWTQLCRHATKLIAQAPECWPQLEALKQRGFVEAQTSFPTTLEWAGVVTRNETGEAMGFASDLMRNFVQRQYDALMLGDLYAQHGQWQEAFARYQSLPLERKCRPLSAEDRTQLERIIPVFGAALYAEASNGVAAVQRLFIQGCQHLLGFSEVTFWCGGNGRAWELAGEEGTSTVPPTELKAHIAEMLPDKFDPAKELLELSAPWGDYAVAHRLQSRLSNYSNFIVVSEIVSSNALTRERRRLLGKLLQALALAFNHAIAIRIREGRIKRGQQQLELTNSMLTALGSRVLDVNGVLQRAAAGMARLGQYKRVLFCLVDPRGERIQGVLDHKSEWSQTDVAKLTDYGINDVEADIQPWVIANKKYFVTSNAALAKLTNKTIVKLTGMKAEAIVPIFNEADEAIGTIHIERADGFEPPEDEIADLVRFGRLLATVIEQAERVNLMQVTLDNIPTPVAIVNARKKFRYANRAAAQALNVPHHWQENTRHGLGLEHLPSQMAKAIEYAMQNGQAMERLEDGQTISYLISQRIQDWREKTVGAFLYLPDGTNWGLVTKAMLHIALQHNTEKAVEASLEVAKDLEYQQGRLYVLDEETQEMISRRCYGMADEQAIKKFDSGELSLPLAHEASWLCIKAKEPVVFCYDPNGIDGAELRTPQGLEYRVITQPYFQYTIRKRPGEFWVDVPLMANDRPLGKLSLACGEYLTPQRLDLLRALTGSENELFADLFRHEREQLERDWKLREQAAEKMVFSVAHNLATRFGSFPGFLHLYRSYERELPELRELNDDFAHALNQAQTLVKRAKERLTPELKAKKETVSLGDYLAQTCKNLLAENEYHMAPLAQPVQVMLDPHLIELALSELIDNSRVAQTRPECLSVEIAAHPLSAGEVQVTYRDNGPGIAEEVRERIFDDFFSYRPEAPRGSSGIGMGFVKRVVQAHDGRIEIGHPSNGVEFLITLPCYFVTQAQEGGLNGTHPHR